jgi:hypothetical protein
MDVLARGVAVIDHRRGLYLQGRVMGVARRLADHADFWHMSSLKFPADDAFRRQSIHYALRAGKLDQAEAAVAALIAARRTHASDSNFIIGLAYIYERRVDHDAIRSLVRRFLDSLHGKPDYRIAALRLSRIIDACFVREHTQDLVKERRRNHRQLAGMLSRTPFQPAPRRLLERVLRLEEDLTKRSSVLLLDTDVSREQCRAFVHLVNSKLAANEPFSFVRIGDGEAACLPYEPYLAWLAKGDAIERERIWWGEALTDRQRKRMTRLVFNAIWGADCIGIPTVSRFLRELRLTENDSLDHGLTGRGLRSALYCTEHFSVFRGTAAPVPIFTSCHLHQDMERWDLYPALLDGKRDVALVSCHPGLASLVERRFGVSVSANLVLPPDRVSAPAFASPPADTRRLPDILDEVVGKVKDLPRGHLVLIGAGYLGKWLVDVVRAQGGVALDVGSVFDYWLGLTTRSYLDLNPVQ